MSFCVPSRKGAGRGEGGGLLKGPALLVNKG